MIYHCKSIIRTVYWSAISMQEHVDNEKYLLFTCTVKPDETGH